MSNPADIEVAGVPDWLEEDYTPAAAAAATTTSTTNTTNSVDVEDHGSTSWLVDDSNIVATAVTAPLQQSTDNIIYAPSRAGRVSNDLETSHITKSKKKKQNEKNGSNRHNTADIIDTRNPNVITNIEANNTHVNNGGDNNVVISNAEAASQKTWGQYFRESFQRDGRLMLITLLILILMNIPVVWWALYPFVLFDAWVHEMCHGMAAIIAGGEIVNLQVFPDGSGLATWSGNMDQAAFVSSAGYQGTAVVGFLLLIFRRTKRGPRTGTMVLACAMLLSCILWMRNAFGFAFIFCMGLILAGLAVKLPSFHIRNVYVFLAMIISLNAISRVQDLFGNFQFVNGEPTQTDAHTMAAIVGGSYLLWATLWLILAITMTILGILFAIPGPDEVADFTCCGVCQDFGCFKLCNYPGQRWMSRFRGNDNSNDQENPNGGASDNNNSSGEP